MKQLMPSNEYKYFLVNTYFKNNIYYDFSAIIVVKEFQF